MSDKQQLELEHHLALIERADEILDKAILNGDVFSEMLTNWAMSQAIEEMGAKP